ncbi:MAG: class I tRNA ligase family protein, partial [Rubrivivax sp.]
DLGAFYLDVLKDRLYTTARKSVARRSAQTALVQLTQAMLRWMAPILSFTAEEAWQVLGAGETIFTETFIHFPPPDAALLARWARLRAIRDLANKEIEALRTTGRVGSSLQAALTITAAPDDHALLASLGDDLKFVFIVSQLTLQPADTLTLAVAPVEAPKCARCWHWRADVGADAAHPELCSRCVDNLFGTGEDRRAA